MKNVAFLAAFCGAAYAARIKKVDLDPMDVVDPNVDKMASSEIETVAHQRTNGTMNASIHSSDYHALKQGTCCCRLGRFIETVNECITAVAAVAPAGGWTYWVGTQYDLPTGCSYRGADNNMHFNSHPHGRPRADMVPVCKGPAVTVVKVETCLSPLYEMEAGGGLTIEDKKRVCEGSESAQQTDTSYFNEVVATVSAEASYTNGIASASASAGLESTMRSSFSRAMQVSHKIDACQERTFNIDPSKPNYIYTAYVTIWTSEGGPVKLNSGYIKTLNAPPAKRCFSSA